MAQIALSRRTAGTVVSRLVHNRTRPDVGRVALRSFSSTTQHLDASPHPPVQSDGIPETPTDTPPHQKDGYLFLNSVFPIRIGRWDLRHYIGLFRKDALLAQLNSILSNVHAHQFEVVQLQPYVKDGGVYIHYRYSVSYGTSAEDVEKASEEVEKAMEAALAKNGGVPRWLGFNWGQGEVWPVKGRPWREDLNRYASPYLRITFDGPDVPEEALYDLLRPYGRITVMDLPSSSPPPPAGVPRSALIRFHSLRSSVVARNVLHGYDFQPLTGPSGAQPQKTRLRTMYQPPVQEHALRDWIAKHPRIVAPVALFLLGSLTYTVWDPIRTLMIEGKIMDWFDYRNYESYQWLHTNILSHLPWVAPPILKKNSDDDDEEIESNSVAGEHHRLRRKRKSKSTNNDDQEVWQARHEASDALIRYLTDSPTTIAFLHGPAGSSKDPLLNEAVASTGSRRTLVIDCTALLKNSSDSGLVNSLASQTGYWPVFTFLNNFNTWIDLAAVGLIGQKAGLATSLPDQVKQVLTVVGSALEGVNTSYKEVEKEALRHSKMAKRKEQEEEREEKVKKGEWHDPRLDAVAGNGVTSELGVGDEKLDDMSVEKNPRSDVKTGEAVTKEGEAEEKSEDTPAKSSWLPSISFPPFPSLPSLPEVPSSIKDLTALPGRILGSSDSTTDDESNDTSNTLDPERLRHESAEAQAIRALPILVIKNYNARSRGHKDSEEVMDVIASWAAGLVENSTAHVVVISDKRDNSKRLAKVMPRKPLAMVGMSDADTASALRYVKGRLSAPSTHGSDAPLTTQVELDKLEIARIEQLGGRVSDLDSLIDKVRAGQTVSDAVEDIIRRDVGELRKNAFGDDVDDAKRLQWTREQAWGLFKRMTKKEEVPYYEVLVSMFGGDEAALRSMEHAELISISTDNGGRPTFIRPGKPVYKYVFERLASDPVFAATQDLALNIKAATTAETTIKACEDELHKLHEIGSSRAVRKREDYLLTKMKRAQDTLENLEYEAGELRRVLAKGG